MHCWRARPAGPRWARSARLPPRGSRAAAVFASVGARLYRIRRDGDRLVREPRPLILPEQVHEAWQHPAGGYFYVASSDQRTSAGNGRHHYLNAFRVDSSGDLQPFGNAVALPHRPIYITVDQRGEYVLSAHSFPSSITVRRLNADGSIGDMVEQRAGLDAGFYAHAIYLMPSNRTVLLVARGNEPEPGVHTEDPGGLYLYGFENGRLTDKQTVAPNRGLEYRARHADFHPSGRWVYVDLETQNLLHTYAIRGDDTLSEEPLFSSDHAGRTGGVPRWSDHVLDPHASDQRPDPLRREPGPGHGGFSGRAGVERHREHDLGVRSVDGRIRRADPDTND